MKDNAHIDADEYSEVYLESGAKITIGNALTAELSPVALIRVPDSEYVEGTSLQILDEATAGLIYSNYQMFGLSNPEGMAHNTGYGINSEGKMYFYNLN